MLKKLKNHQKVKDKKNNVLGNNGKI